MQNRCAPAASAALACSRICSGLIIACIGVAASAKRDWAQKPQSSAQPPDFAFTSEHMSVESPKRSLRTSQARSTSAPISSWSVRAPSSSASSKPIRGGTPTTYERARTARASIPDEVLNDLGVALGAGAEGEDLQAVVASLECAGHRGGDADRIELPDLLYLVVELHPARPRDDHVDLLGLVVPVGERMALPGLHLLERDPDLLRVQVAVGEPGLLDLTEAL